MKLLRCTDFGGRFSGCGAETRAYSIEEALEMMKVHGKITHGETDEEVNNPAVLEMAKKITKDV